MLSEWLTEKNGDLSADSILSGSHKKVWWKCSTCGYSWQATIASRNAGNGCSKCFRRNQTSFPEQAIFYYVSQVYEDAISGYNSIFDNKNMEIDIDDYDEMDSFIEKVPFRAAPGWVGHIERNDYSIL